MAISMRLNTRRRTAVATAMRLPRCARNLGSRLTRFSGDGRWWVEGHARIMVLSIGHGLSIFMVIRPAIFTDIQPPWERGELTIIRL